MYVRRSFNFCHKLIHPLSEVANNRLDGLVIPLLKGYAPLP